MNKRFIDDLKSSPYYSRIFKNHEVAMLYISGSRLIGVTDERSDYDLVALTNEPSHVSHVDEYLTYDGVKVHWHYVALPKLISNEGGTALSCVGQAQLANLVDDAVIYINPKYTDVIEFIKRNKNLISYIGAYLLADYHGKLIGDVLQANEICEKDYCKFLYHLCYASYILTGDEVNKQLLCQIKRIRWKAVDDTWKSMAVERIKLLRDYVNANEFDVQTHIDKFNAELRQLLA